GIADTIDVDRNGSVEADVRLRRRDWFYYSADDGLTRAKAAAEQAVRAEGYEPGDFELTSVSAYTLDENGRGLWHYRFEDEKNGLVINTETGGFWESGRIFAELEPWAAPSEDPLPAQRTAVEDILMSVMAD